MEKSKKNLELAKKLLSEEAFSFALNRAYYAAFDAVRAVNALANFDSSKQVIPDGQYDGNRRKE